MAARSGKTIVKVNVLCPHCSFEQLESMAAKSTICRNCGNHFEISVKSKESSSNASALSGLLTSRKAQQSAPSSPAPDLTRTVTCFECRSTHKVSSLAKTTLCPNCGSYVDLQDFNINGFFSRSIRTRGRLIISGRGDLNCGRAVCGSAVIEGRIRGSLDCEGKAVFKSKAKLAGDIQVNHLVIERAADVEFSRPVRAGRVEIMGKLTGTVMCDTEVYIYRKGSLVGAIHAKSLIVDQGGSFVGDTEIRPNLKYEPLPQSTNTQESLGDVPLGALA
ncbi:MAG: polymer-forming cytoskeletal protein [Verrucomicrobiales bacterium]